MLIFYSLDVPKRVIRSLMREMAYDIKLGKDKEDVIAYSAFLFDMVDYDDNLDMFYPGLNWIILETAYNEVTK